MSKSNSFKSVGTTDIFPLVVAIFIRLGLKELQLVISIYFSPSMEEAKEIHSSLKKATGVFMYIKVRFLLLLLANLLCANLLCVNIIVSAYFVSARFVGDHLIWFT